MAVKFFTLLGMITSTLVIGALFQIKYQVADIENQIKKIQEKIAQKQEAIHVLKAEWSYLNKPKRLQELASKYLDLVPPQPSQMVDLKIFQPYSVQTSQAQDFR